MNRRAAIAAVCAWIVAWCAATALSGEVDAGKGLRAEWVKPQIKGISARGKALPDVSATLLLRDPRTQKAVETDRFAVDADLSARDGALWLTGCVTATGTDDAAADLILRIDGVAIPTGDVVKEPLLLPRKLLNCVPIAPLRTLSTEQDELAVCLPPEPPCVYEFRNLPEQKAVELRLPFGFAKEAKPSLAMRAPFAIVLTRTDPAWRFRSALAEYYRLFPERFRRHDQRNGGWFFANETKNIPNPQHFAFHEGSGSVAEDHARDMGMYPYNETSSQTIRLKGPGLPEDYDDAMRQMAALEKQVFAADWALTGGRLADDEKHSGERSFTCSADRADVSLYARQVVVLSPPVDEPLIVSAWSKARNVSGEASNSYSIYIDACCRDGSYLFGQCALFKPGTHDWERAEYVIRPKTPLVELRVHPMFRYRTGTVWFDDIRVARQSRPEENLLKNGGWELLGKRDDIQYVRDNACTDADAKYRVHITDNFSSDVKPTRPLSLLRFACNVDPSLAAPDRRPTPAGRTTEMFDRMFKNTPEIDGCYIDSCASWCARAINHRRDHFVCADSPLTYDPKTFAVGPHGLFAAYKWLRFLQDRYRPLGKTVFGNMGPKITAWPCYLGLDIIGIESSMFRDTARMAHHRFGGCTKPVLSMNFMNLHHLDDRPTAEEFVLASAHWGHFPATGREVREGYESYGDVCHTYYPALMEMGEAGWRPIPCTNGVPAERFGAGDVIYLTVRAPEEGREERLTLLPEALAGIQGVPVVMDAVQLCPVEAAVDGKGLHVDMIHGARVLTILRIASRPNTEKWLIERAARHCHNAAIVRGRSGNTDRLNAIAESLRRLNAGGDNGVGEVFGRIEKERQAVEAEKDSLEKTSTLTELLDAERAIAEWALFTASAQLDIQGSRLGPVSGGLALTPGLDAARSGARLLGAWVEDGRSILRLLHDKKLPTLTPPEKVLTVRRGEPGAKNVRVALSVPVPGTDQAVTVIRPINVYFTPVVTAKAETVLDREKGVCTIRLTVARLAGPMPLTIKAPADRLPLQPAQASLGADDTVAVFTVPLAKVPAEIIELPFAIHTAEGQRVASVEARLTYLPAPPPGDLALANSGATATADTSYPGYTPNTAIDGVWDVSRLPWQKKAWASRDSALPTGHRIEIALPKPTSVSQLWIYWRFAGSQTWCGHEYDVEVWSNGAWQKVASVRNGPAKTVSVHQWKPIVTDKIRIHQLQGGGPRMRPHIMWVTEACVYR